MGNNIPPINTMATDNSATKNNKKQTSRRVDEIEGQLRQAILNGRFKVGARLPTEPKLTKEFNVSRTVLREAVSALRSDGLLQSRQGAGVFVLRNKPAGSPLSLLTDATETISDIIEELELRTAVEIEAAGIACQRASPAQLADIQTKHFAFTNATENGKPTETEDAEFHRAIARATNNGRFVAFLAHLGARTIPRAMLKATLGRDLVASDEVQLNQEHEAIVEAFLARDVQAARKAMRVHLGGSIERYSALIANPKG